MKLKESTKIEQLKKKIEKAEKEYQSSRGLVPRPPSPITKSCPPQSPYPLLG